MSFHRCQGNSTCGKWYSVTKCGVGPHAQEMHNLDIRLVRACNMYFTMHLKVDER